MRNSFILFFLLIPSLVFGAIHTDTVWEVDVNGTGAAATAGCGFNASNASPGTDRSTSSPTPFDTGTDLVSTDATTTPCTITSATHNFVADDQGNLIQITAGTNWTTGFYEIVSTASNIATLDRACGSSASITGGTWDLGGACIHPMDIAGDGNQVAGNNIHIKAGTYTKRGSDSAILSTCVAGTATGQIRWIGYKTTRNDTPTLTDRPYFDATSTTNGMSLEDGNSYENISVDNSTSHGVTGGCCTQGNCWLINVKILDAGADGINGEIRTFGTEVSGSTDNAYELAASGNYPHWYDYWHNNTDRAAANCSSCASSHYFSIADTNTVGGFSSGRTNTEMIGNIAYGNGGTGIQCGVASSASTHVLCYNNVANDNTTNGFLGKTSGGEPLNDYNAAEGNGTDMNTITAGNNHVTADPLFTDAAGGDFTLQDSSPLLNAGFGASGADRGLTVPGDRNYNWNIGMSQNATQAGGGAVTTAHTFVQ